jgi:hypothetical protein
VTPAEYSRGTAPNKDINMEDRDKNYRIGNFLSLPKRTVQIVINVILIACVIAYFIAAVLFYNSQGKINVL